MTISNNILSKNSIPKLFVKYCIPAVIAMIISGVQGMIDGMFVGNYVHSNALASVNIAMPFMQLIIGVSMITSIGAQSYIGINLGMGHKEKAQNCLHTFKILICICAGLITVLGLTLNKQIALLLGANATLLADSSTYIKVISIFAIPMCMMFYIGFLNRVIAKPEKYFLGTVLSIVVNISLDYILIVYFRMGVLGAALATGLAYTSALFVVVSPMLNKENVINLFVGKFSTESVRHVLYNGSSEGINSISVAVAIFLFNISLMQISGPGGVAAFTAINYVATFGTMLLFGISDGVGPIVSYNFGAKNYDRVKKMMKLAYICNFVFGVILFLLLFLGGEQLVGLFIKNDPALIELAVSGGRLYGIAFLMSGFNILNSGYFTFIGKGLESVLVAASRGLVFVSIGILMLPKFLGINGIWLSVPFAELCAVVIGIFLLTLNKKKLAATNSLQSYDKAVALATNDFAMSGTAQTCDRNITVNREFGSGGREVAKRLADALGCAYFDKELMAFLSKNSGPSSDLLSEMDKVNEDNFPYTFSRSFMAYDQLPASGIETTETLILQAFAEKTKGVYVGRCGNHIINSQNPFKVFIYSSDINFKIDRCVDKAPEILQTSTREKVGRDILAIDNKRKNHFKAVLGQEWADKSNYHLCIDTSEVGVNKAVDIILCALCTAK